MSILRLQTASPNLKNDGFPKEILTFLKNQVFVLEDWFGSFLTLFWAHVGVLMGFLGLLDRSNGVCVFGRFSGNIVLKRSGTSCPKNRCFFKISLS